jgi:hypothetical protein
MIGDLGLDLSHDKGQLAGFCEDVNDSSGSIKCGKFFGYQWTCLFLKDTAQCILN